MPTVAADSSLVRGSVDLTIAGIVYPLVDFKRTRGKARMEKDYDKFGKPAGVSIAEDFEEISGTIHVRSDRVAPPKFTVFAYDGKNWFIYDRPESGSTAGLQDYAVSIIECVSGAIVTS